MIGTVPYFFTSLLAKNIIEDIEAAGFSFYQPARCLLVEMTNITTRRCVLFSKLVVISIFFTIVQLICFTKVNVCDQPKGKKGLPDQLSSLLCHVSVKRILCMSYQYFKIIILIILYL